MICYILSDDGKTPIPEPNPGKWSEWFARDRLKHKLVTSVGPYDVSTVFLGTDHGFGSKEPLLWETMIFGDDDKFRSYQTRHASFEAAAKGHKDAVDYVRSNEP